MVKDSSHLVSNRSKYDQLVYSRDTSPLDLFTQGLIEMELFITKYNISKNM